MCPNCGSSQFIFDSEDNNPSKNVKCKSCGKNYTQEYIRQMNSENISKKVKEFQKEVIEDFKKDIKNMLKKDLGGSKFITLKFR